MTALSLLIIPLGQLLAGALACGLNLYASIAIAGLASRYGWMGFDLPTGLRGLENAIVIGSASALYLVEFVVDKMPYVDAVWDAIHSFIRPLTAGLLTALAIDMFTLDVRLVAALLAAAVAFSAHAAKAGARIVAYRSRRRVPAILLSLLEDAAAVAIAIAALRYPTAAILIGGAVLAIVLLTGPVLWRAAALGLRALNSRLRGFFGDARWRTRAELPRRLRKLVEPEAFGRRPVQVTRACLNGLGGPYRHGYLVVDDDRCDFVYYGFLGPRLVSLPLATDVTVRPGVLADAAEVRTENGKRFTLFLLKDGPPAPNALAELRMA